MRFMGAAAMLYDRLSKLNLEISGYELEPLELTTASGWSRHTTQVHLLGGGHEGCGEDVNYKTGDQAAFQSAGPCLDLAGSFTLASFSRRLDQVDLFPGRPGTPADPLFRRWALESAALDLALRQAQLSLPAALGRPASPARFVVSLGLGEPPDELKPLRRILDANPAARFKVDLAPSWTAHTVAALADMDRVDTVDLKGLYRGTFQGPPANPDQYRQVAELLPGVWIEDPHLNADTSPVLEPHLDRVTWDANLHSLADILQLSAPPRCVNIKPSRFGFLSELLRIYEYCEARGIKMYGGGQFELGAGRDQIQMLAAIFHPDTANDIAPGIYNQPGIPDHLPSSPLPAPAAGTGFGGPRNS
jgi:L-alanine-DL-glutamate epimerase-like enolase superfamily enzyme